MARSVLRGVWAETLLKGGADDLEIPVEPVQADVEQDAPPAGFPDLVPHPPGLVQDGLAAAVVGVGHDVPILEEGQQVAEFGRGGGGVHHDRQTHLIRQFPRLLEGQQRFETRVGAHLDAHDQVPVLLNHLPGLVEVQQPIVVVLVDVQALDNLIGSLADGGDVQEGQNAVFSSA